MADFCESSASVKVLSGCFSGQQGSGNSTQLRVLPKKSWNLIELTGLCLDTYKTGKKSIVINDLCMFEMHLFVYLIWHTYKTCSEYRCMTLILVIENYKITEMLLGKDMCESFSPALCLMQAVANIHLGMDLLGKSENFVHRKVCPFCPTPYLPHLFLILLSARQILFSSNMNSIRNTTVRKKKTCSFTSPDFLSLIRHWSCLM